MTVSESPGTDVELEGTGTDERVAGLTEYVTLADGVEGTFTVEETYTGEPLGEVPACTEADVAEAFERAGRAQERWAERPVAERAEVVMDVHDEVLDRQEELLDVVQAETGKDRRTAHEELLDVAMNARHYAVRAEGYLKPERRKGALPLMTRTTEYHHPKGVVGMISPWNYPLALVISDAVPALLAGNAVVLKPAKLTSYTALKAAEVLRDAGVPEDLFQVVTGSGSTIGTPLIDRSDFVMFTGSTATGKHVAEQAGRNLIDFSMELGGKNPAIVLPDADLDKAVEGLIRGCFTNAGQLCISIERLYVHEDVREEFTERFVAAVEDMDLGATYDYEPDMGSLIDGDHLEEVEEHVERAKAEGATLLTGGEARPDVGPYFYEPTVFTDVDDDDDLTCTETFGPVVAIYGVESVEEAVERANDSRYGLNASVWTEDEERGVDVATRIECGTVNVNEGYAAAYASTDAPMGGMKDSGVGRRHGDYGIMKYTESQTVAVQRGMGMTKPPGVPYNLYATMMNKTMRLFKKVPGLR